MGNYSMEGLNLSISIYRVTYSNANDLHSNVHAARALARG